MSVKASLGSQFISSIIERQDLDILTKHGNLDHLFREQELAAWRYLQEHLTRHGELPARDTLMQHCDVRLPSTTPEPGTYYLDHMRQRHIESRIREAVDHAGQYLGKSADTRDPRQALEVLTQAVQGLATQDRASQVLDFRDTEAAMIQAHNEMRLGTSRGVESGWPSLDEVMGGMLPGDLVTIVGRPGEGKTWALTSRATHAWHQGYSAMVVTVEMTALSVVQRLGAIETGIPHKAIRLGQMSDGQRRTFKARMAKAAAREQPFYVVDATQVPTVDELVLLARQLRPDVVFLDGAYLLRGKTDGLNKFRRVAEVVDQLKFDLATQLQIPVMASFQFSRDAVKQGNGRKKGEDRPPTLEDIAFADEIGQNSSVVLGLLGHKSPEAIKSKPVSILKGRNGEVGEFQIAWEFRRTMDFSEVAGEQDAGDLEHV